METLQAIALEAYDERFIDVELVDVTVTVVSPRLLAEARRPGKARWIGKTGHRTFDGGGREESP
jgi:hypothetical protein